MIAAGAIVRMDNYMRLQSSSGSSSGDADELEETPSGQSSFSPLQSVVAFDGTVQGSFDAYIASLPPKNNQFISDERFQGFLCILKGNTPEIDNAQLNRDREKLFNARELGPKARDGTRFPYGKWEVHHCVDTRTGESIDRPKRENTYKGRNRPWCQRQSVKQ